MDPEAPVQERTLEGIGTNLLLFLRLHRVVALDACTQNVDLTLGEDVHLGQKRAVGFLEGIREEQAEDEATEDGESSHERKQPEPTRLTADATHVQDTVREQL